MEVIAVFNPLGEVKPLYIIRDGKKSKITKINCVTKIKDTVHFSCVVDGDIVVVSFDGVRWWVD